MSNLSENNVKDLNNIPSRIAALRDLMHREGITAYMIPTADYHDSEYVNDFFKCREYMSGFTGSNGTLVVMNDFAGLWTDGRYFLQAESELQGSGIELYKMGMPGVPTISAFLQDKLNPGDVLGFDGRVVNAATGIQISNAITRKGATVCETLDLVDEIWSERPSLPDGEVYILSEQYCGESCEERIEKIRAVMTKKDCSLHLISKLDDICWILNLRGSDIECNPVFLSYLVITDLTAELYVDVKKINNAVRAYLTKNNIQIKEYDYFYAEFEQKINSKDFKILYDPQHVSYLAYLKIKNSEARITEDVNPSDGFKAIKSSNELEYIRDIYVKDSVALTRFIYWLKRNVGKIDIDEMSAASYLDDLRRSIPGFIDLSFPTISAYAENAAIIHYEATEETNKKLMADSFYLVDSGGQYLGGTTDVTRTISLGQLDETQKRDFTLVLAGMLRLCDAKFAEGCTGRNLDILARQKLWENGLDYRHGTGHGIGYILNVHEGPQNINFKQNKIGKEAILQPGMIVSDEPGLYVDGKYGIRTENILETIEMESTEYGRFFGFSFLTYVPIDLDAVDIRYLDGHDIELLNQYHQDVYKKISPYLTDTDEKVWLKEATRAIV